jgi:hypothetical protein
MGKSKAHIQYKTKNGTRVPGVTTILGVMAKPALVPWANKLGLQGIDVGKYVDDLADIGTLAHAMAEAHCLGIKCDTSDYSANQISIAENCLIKFFDWHDQNRPEPLGNEMVLVSESRMYGGTADFYCSIKGKKVLVDFKTCKAIYGEMKTQVIAYKDLLVESGHQVDECIILRIGRSENEGFECQSVYQEDLHRKRFMACQELYNLNKQLEK